MASANDNRFKHGHTRFKKPSSPTYRSWSKMINRCHNPRNEMFHLYGGRGIEVCQRWRQSFKNFLDDMGDRPKGKTIDRYPNNDGNYEPGNCRWATPQEQMDNSRRSKMLTYEGISLSIRGWAKKLGVTHTGIRYRLNLGWSIGQIVEHFKAMAESSHLPRPKAQKSLTPCPSILD